MGSDHDQDQESDPIAAKCFDHNIGNDKGIWAYLAKASGFTDPETLGYEIALGKEFWRKTKK
jgi:hypothetical protein